MARVDNGALCARARCVMTGLAPSTPPRGTVRLSAPIISPRLPSTGCPRNRGRYINSKIQTIKKRAYGFRNREHFKTAIYFHCGGLHLYPVTH